MMVFAQKNVENFIRHFAELIFLIIFASAFKKATSLVR